MLTRQSTRLTQQALLSKLGGVSSTIVHRSTRTFTTNTQSNSNPPNNEVPTNNSISQAKLEELYYELHPSWLGKIPEAQVTHTKPKQLVDHLAYWAIKTIRFNFDVLTGFKFFTHTKETWLTRVIFLETVAGVPGSIGGTLRHLASLRRMKRDHGWIHTLLEEAENERMHLLTALNLKQPGRLFRFMVLLAQGIFYNFYFISYLLSPKFCHRMVGYLEEEAVITYTKLVKEIDDGNLSDWKTERAPEIARQYWKLPDDATVRDVFVMIRSDEANHRDVNHALAALKIDDVNPFTLKH